MSRPALQRFAACWGNGDFGRLGHGPNCSPEWVPRVVAALADMNISAVEAGGAHTAVLADDGSVWTMGLNDAGQLGHSPADPHVPVPQQVDLPDPVAALAAGHFHTLALTRGGDVWAWGRNGNGQLGIGTTAGRGDHCTPQRLKDLAGAGVVSIAAGAEHSLAATSTGEVFTWGSTANGRLGQRHRSGWRLWQSHEPTPRLLRSLAGTKVASVAAGHMHSGVVTEHCDAMTWGGGRFWQLGHGSASQDEPAPLTVPGLRGVRQLALGGTHSLALLDDSRRVAVWGVNQNGVLGLGSKADMNVRSPTFIPGVFCEQVSCGWKHNAAVGRHGQLLTWGWGGSQGSQSFYETRESGGGQLGLDSDFDYWSPTQVPAILPLHSPGGMLAWKPKGSEEFASPAWRVVHVSAGFNHTAAVIEMAPGSQ